MSALATPEFLCKSAPPLVHACAVAPRSIPRTPRALVARDALTVGHKAVARPALEKETVVTPAKLRRVAHTLNCFRCSSYASTHLRLAHDASTTPDPSYHPMTALAPNGMTQKQARKTAPRATDDPNQETFSELRRALRTHRRPSLPHRSQPPPLNTHLALSAALSDTIKTCVALSQYLAFRRATLLHTFSPPLHFAFSGPFQVVCEPS